MSVVDSWSALSIGLVKDNGWFTLRAGAGT
jgi:hypothetical protein